MAYSLANLEKNMVGAAKQKLNSAFAAVSDKAAGVFKLPTIGVNVGGGTMKPWFGFSNEDWVAKYTELYALGQILSCNYFVTFEPYNNNATADLPLFHDGLSGFLVTETNLPLVDSVFEEVKVGIFMDSFLSGVNSPDIQMVFHETADARIMNSMMDWENMKFNGDGTINPPSSYAMRITIGVFSKTHGLDYKPFQRTFLAAPMQSEANFESTSSSETAKIPVTFKVLRPFME